MYKTLKKDFPNVYILLITIAIGIWFRIIGNMVDIFAPKNGTLYYYAAMAMLSLAFLYFNDFSFNELHETNPSSIAGAVSGAIYEGGK